MTVLRAAAACLALVWTGLALAAEPSWPALTGRVVDGANLIAPDVRQRIEDKLKAHEDKTSDQVVVATVPSLQDVTIEDFANGLFRHWQLGQNGKNNGALLIVAPKERKVRIEVGYGLEGALTDALSKVIVTTAIAPKFKTGDFTGGIEAGVDAILTILAGDAEEWQRRAEVRSDESALGEDIAVIIAMVLIFLFVVAFLRGLRQQGGARRHRLRNGRWVSLPQSTSWSTGSSSSSGWSSGGGGWSSGGGGFSGGGGSSGGGGASGDW
ncbi:TPM domain-containing protein [Bosea sp. (in: a-proteobacteria)]|uniref:TPM domain-containing protein n=1 Tax=Bosea sp. (in: a-proteobacteria) TaxID=1871050 RepID=UPI002618A9B1|nr:TPM domain-containing protein [Bosea sp. (in: a-proteobacteria)]MCO5090552.1 TPM domain-containing protein [Bosea sp. (in: a-proteobacteria)]